MLNSITRILENAHQPDSTIRPTELYNEGWMLRIVLDWFASNTSSDNKFDHPFAFQKEARWYSEIILPTHFPPRKKSGDTLAETRTHADGVVGHFQIEENTKAGFELTKEATQFIVIEVKMRSKLSHKTTRIDYWDQVSRNIACMAEAFARKKLSAKQLTDVGFYVTAPAEQIEKHKFEKLLSETIIKEKVERRILEYGSESIKDATSWYQKYFLPLMDQMKIEAISWESITEFIRNMDSANGKKIGSFYDRCLEFN